MNMMNPEEFNVVSRPSHYAEGRKYEPKDVIRDWGLNFNLGSAVKYISRAGRKDDILQDLKKARQFLDFEIEAITEERKNLDGWPPYRSQVLGEPRCVEGGGCCDGASS